MELFYEGRPGRRAEGASEAEMKRIFIIVTICLVFFGTYFMRSNLDASLPPVSVPTPTPMPFVEMTIPYLANRTYESVLGERQFLSENASYTSYLTSYTSDGLKINALLTVPKGDKPFPAIVFVHGYIAPTIYRTTERYGDYVDYLARNGFVVMKIDLRGHGQSEGNPGGAYYSSDYIIDTLNARAALASFDVVNPKAIGLWGHSMAGNVLMRAFSAKPDIPAVVIWAGAGYTYTDLVTYRISEMSYRPPSISSERQRRRQALRDAYGEFDPDHPFWSQVAVTKYLSNLQGALQVHHAVDDAVVNIEYSRNLMKLLDQTSVDHELFEYPAGGHNISGSSFSLAMARTVEFFRKHLSD